MKPSPVFIKKNPHGVSWKNWEIDDFINTAMRVLELGLPLNNEEFVNVTNFMKLRSQRAQEVNK